MGEEDNWDLYAVVRSCTSAAANLSHSTTDTPVENGNFGNHLDCLASLTFEDDDDPFSFPDLVQPRVNGWQELQDSYKPFLPTSATGQGNIPLSSIHGFGEFSGQNQPQVAHPQQLHHHLQQPPPPPPPPSPPVAANTPPPFSLRFNNIRPQLQHAQQSRRQQLHHQQSSDQRARSNNPVLSLRNSMQLPVSRSARKKKCHHKRQVMQVTAENLCNDAWAWRKYGQKPIKGSPYPRNYYRCSSSKGCGARKQVERSQQDPNMFIVSYTGDHTHPRPTHRNSLAGSTRNKFAAALQTEATTSNNKEADELEKAPSSSPLSVTSLSPTTPLSASIDHNDGGAAAAAAGANENIHPEGGIGNMDIGADMKEGHNIMESDEEDEYDDDNILIPNMTLNEDLFKGFQELGCAAGTDYGAFAVGCNSNNSGSSAKTGGLELSPDFGDNFSSWAVGTSAATAGTAERSG